MKYAELTIDEYRLIYRQRISSSRYFNPATMPNGRFFVSEAEINAYIATGDTKFDFLKSKTLIDYDSMAPDVTPPTPMGVGVMIPSDYPVLKLFPDLKFSLNGYVVPIVEHNGGYAVDLAYLGWEGFRKEQDYLYNKAIFNVFSTLWYELKDEVNAGNIVNL